MKQKRKNFLTIFLTLTLLVAILPNGRSLVTVEGAVKENDTILVGTKIETVYGEALEGSDGKPYYENSFTAVNYGNGSYETMKTKSFYCKETIGIDSAGNQSWLYCVEKNAKFSREGYSSSNVNNSNYLLLNAERGTLAAGLNKLAKDKKIAGLDGVQSIRYILTATIYGWQPDAIMPPELKNQGLNDWDWYFGTQVVIWEFQQGIRQSPTQCNGNGLNAGDVLFQWVEGRPAEYAYRYVLKMMAQHKTIPSFATGSETNAKTYTLRWNRNNKRYEATLSDTAGYAFPLQFADGDIHCEKNGSNYTIYTTKTIVSPILCSMQKDIHIAENQKLLVWGKSGKQTMVTGMQDPVEFYLKIQTEWPKISINKTGDGPADIADKIFYVYKDGAATACLQMTTDANGKASGYLPGDGSYKIVEQNASGYDVTYTIDGVETQKFTYPGSAFYENNVTVHVNNAQKKGVFRLKKESEDGVIQGFQFRLEGNGTSLTGTTDVNGYLMVNGSTDIPLKPGVYTVTEINPPSRYERLEPFTIQVSSEKTVTKTVKNTLKDSELVIQKASEDGVVAGLAFKIAGVTLAGVPVDMTVVTGPEGKVTVKMEQGTYTVFEINTPGKYFVPNAQTVTLSETSKTLNFTNELKPVKLQILKTSDDGIVDGFKFRVTGNEVDITGFTNQDGYVVFGEKAYLVEAQGLLSDLKRIAVVSKDATGFAILSDLGLDSTRYSIVYNNNSAISLDTVIANYNATTNASVIGSGWLAIKNITDNTFYAQIVFRGSTEKGSAAGGADGVTKNDLTKAASILGKTYTGNYQNSDVYVAAYDIDRDGLVTQADYDVMQKAFADKKDIVGATILDLKAGDYRIQEIEVPERYTNGFDQVVTVDDASSIETVKVKNYVKDAGIKIVKQSVDGVIAGVQFQITGTTNAGTVVDMTVVTDATGMVAQKLSYGTYTVTEISVPNQYVIPTAQTVTIAGEDYVTVVFENQLKDGSLKLRKTAEDGVVANIPFRVQSIVTTDGTAVDTTVRTNANGIVSVSLPEGTYVITELNVANRYRTPVSQIVTLKAGLTSTVSFHNQLKTPCLKIIKTSEDGIVEGVSFSVEGTTLTGDMYSETFITDANGLVTTEIPQGTYTVTEALNPQYEVQKSQTVTLKNDETVEVAFANVLKDGKLKIQKISDDGNVVNIPFRICGMGADGRAVDLLFKTDENGVITKALKPGTYTVTELLDDIKYIIPEPQTVTVTYDQTVTVYFENRLKKFTLSLTKTDGSAELGIPHQAGAMAGAVYGLYKEDGTLLNQYTTDRNGTFTTDAIPCEVAYVQEITAPMGYRVDESKYWLSSSVDECYQAVTNLSLAVVDYPVMGSINILKKMGLEDEWEYESGAVFQIYPKTAGSYDVANEWERDEVITDAASEEVGNTGEIYTGGEAGTKNLPLGTYIVHQVSGTAGYRLAEDIEVTITEENTVVSLEIFNEAQEEFPFTGGSGVIRYAAGGILCMLMAFVVAVVAKKRETV